MKHTYLFEDCREGLNGLRRHSLELEFGTSLVPLDVCMFEVIAADHPMLERPQRHHLVPVNLYARDDTDTNRPVSTATNLPETVPSGSFKGLRAAMTPPSSAVSD